MVNLLVKSSFGQTDLKEKLGTANTLEHDILLLSHKVKRLLAMATKRMTFELIFIFFHYTLVPSNSKIIVLKSRSCSKSGNKRKRIQTDLFLCCINKYLYTF